MPRENQFFDNLSEEEILTERRAIEVLMEYCEENDIPIHRLSNNVINDFIQTLRYAPHDIETDEIARRTGVTSYRGPSIPSEYIQHFTYSSVPNDTLRPRMQQPRMVQATSRNSISVPLQGTRRSVNFSELLQQTENSLLTQEVIPSMIDSVEAITPTREEEIDDLMMAGLWTAGSTPKKKKRKRSEYDMVKEIVRGENFPRPNFREWSNNREFEDIIHDWYSNVEYREQWIFTRREREGFNRRNIGFFSLDDVMARMSKRKNPHPLDSSFSKFYDWKLGGTDWILRLELFWANDYDFLIVRHIHKPTDTEIKFDVRYWNGERFKEINCVWCQQKNNENQFDRVFGSNDEGSPYYVRPYEEDYDESDYNEDDYEEESYEDSPF